MESTKDFLSAGELTAAEFESILDLADVFKKEREEGRFIHRIPNTSLALIFEKPSTRTRVSFEVSMFELGGHAVVLSTENMQTSRGETLEDTAKALGRYCHAIAARVVSHQTLLSFSSSVSIPVINALSDLYHPCQTLADLLTIRQVKGRLKGLKLVWVGDGNNVCNSLLCGGAVVGLNMTVACPKQYSPLDEAVKFAREKAESAGTSIEITDNAKEAVVDSDVIATDTFVSMGNDLERDRRLRDFLPNFQVNDQIMAFAKKDVIFMHCLPAHRGEEVTSSVIDGPHSVVWQEAENRLHAQKAVLYTLLKK